MKVCHVNINSPLITAKRLGILEGENEVIDVNKVWEMHYQVLGRYNAQERAIHNAPPSLFQLLKLKDNPLVFLRETLDLYAQYASKGLLEDFKNIRLTLGHDVKLTKPLDQIATYRDFYAHEKHVKKGFEKRGEKIPPEWYEIPAYYKGSTLGFIGPEETIPWPRYTNILDYELELAAVIGRDGKNIKASNACHHIFGFTILNDISARDIQKKEMAIRLGPAKGKDFCSVIGPVITTIDEFDFHEPNLKMKAFVNGELWSEGQSGDAHFSFSQMIEHVTQDEWTVAGDLYGSGTVGTGCGLELGKWPALGDQIDLWVENIGHLVNPLSAQKEGQ